MTAMNNQIPIASVNVGFPYPDCMVIGVYLDEDTYLSVIHDNIDKIVYHQPRGEGDKHYVDVYFKDKVVRYFRFDDIISAKVAV